jgi:hypothetical protein
MVCNTISVFLHIVYRPDSKQLENTTFRTLDLFPSSGEGRETPTLLSPLKRPAFNHRSCVENVLFSSHLEFRMMHIVHKHSNFECQIADSSVGTGIKLQYRWSRSLVSTPSRSWSFFCSRNVKTCSEAHPARYTVDIMAVTARTRRPGC